MSFIGGLFSGSQGVSWQPERAASAEQAQQQYQQVQDQLAQQRAFTTMIGAQTPGALESQRLLQEQLRQQMMGQGPSVAQRQLAETTGQNVAQQAALLAGQRGASANVGLMGRQIGQMGTQAQQQSAGQAATLRAQEQLAAQAGLGALAGTQIGQMAGAQQLGAQSALQSQQNILNAIAQANAAKAGVAQQTAAGQGRMVGGIFEGLAGLGGKGAAKGAAGGEVGKDFANYADGGGIGSDAYWARLQNDLGTMASNPAIDTFGMEQAGQRMGGALRNMFASKQRTSDGSEVEDYTSLAHGGTVPAMVSPGERYLPPKEVEKVADGKKSAHKAGEMIPGKAKVKGDSYENDTVSKDLQKGGIVIPRSVMQSTNPADSAQKFVAAVLAKQKMKRK